MSNLEIPGDELVTLDKSNMRKILYGQSALMVIGGGIAAAMGYPIGFIVAGVGLLPGLIGHFILTQRLVTTTEGVHYVRGSRVVDARRWEEIAEVELETKINTSSSGSSSKSHTLIFKCKDGKPLRYLCGWPQRDRIAVLAKHCKQRDIPAIV